MKRTRTESTINELLSLLTADDLRTCTDDVIAITLAQLQKEFDRRNRYFLMWWEHGAHRVDGIAVKKDDSVREQQWRVRIEALTVLQHGKWSTIREPNATEADIQTLGDSFPRGWLRNEGPLPIKFSELAHPDTVEDKEAYLREKFGFEPESV